METIELYRLNEVILGWKVCAKDVSLVADVIDSIDFLERKQKKVSQGNM